MLFLIACLICLRCWNHVFQDIKVWLRKHGTVPRVMTLLYIKMMFRKCSMHHLWLCTTDDMLQQMESKCSAPFLNYFRNCIHSDIHCMARWEIQIHGQSESLNFVIKHLQEWREAPIDCMVLSMNYLQSYYKIEIIRGKRSLGQYHLHPHRSGECGNPQTQAAARTK